MAKININSIAYDSIVDGPGLRATVFTQGCPHECYMCHNQQTWADIPKNLYEVEEIVELIEKNVISKKITISGGDPLIQAKAVGELCEQLTNLGYDIWLYTGFEYEEIKDKPQFTKVLNNIDVLVDGKYVHELRDISLEYVGSSNQKKYKLR